MSVHLLVCIHGLWGNPAHLAELARIAHDHTDTHTDHPWDILVTASNANDNTYDGIDWGAERVAQEVTLQHTSISPLTPSPDTDTHFYHPS